MIGELPDLMKTANHTQQQQKNEEQTRGATSGQRPTQPFPAPAPWPRILVQKEVHRIQAELVKDLRVVLLSLNLTRSAREDPVIDRYRPLPSLSTCEAVKLYAPSLPNCARA